MNESKKLRVLVAEDEESFRLVLERVLESAGGYEFEACETGNQVLDALQRKPFDVLILDYEMPEHSGLNILQWMHEQKMDTPVIMLTGAGSENIAVEAMKLGAYDYIRKETFEKEHLPILINSARERYLFRQEKKLLRQAEDERVKTSTTFNLLNNCIRSYGELMNTSLAIVNTEMAVRESELAGQIQGEGSQILNKTFQEMQHQYEVIAMCSKSLLELTRVMFDTFTKGADPAGWEYTLREPLQAAQRLAKRPTRQESTK